MSIFISHHLHLDYMEFGWGIKVWVITISCRCRASFPDTCLIFQCISFPGSLIIRRKVSQKRDLRVILNALNSEVIRTPPPILSLFLSTSLSVYLLFFPLSATQGRGKEYDFQLGSKALGCRGPIGKNLLWLLHICFSSSKMELEKGRFIQLRMYIHTHKHLTHIRECCYCLENWQAFFSWNTVVFGISET